MRYLILGSTLALDERGTPLPLGGARLRALLAALALRGGRAVTVPELVEDVWGDEPPHDAPAALQALVGRLRRVLGRAAVESTPGPGYRLVARPDDIDLYVFQRHARDAAARLDADDPDSAAGLLRTALALFRGPALADLPEHARVRPEAQRLAAVRRRVEADLRRGAVDGLVPELTELTDAYPYDEGFRAQLVRALRAEGRQADALAAYEAARRALADGLGTDPGAELTALHRELLRPAAPPQPRETGNIRRRLTSFVGREPDLAALRTDLTHSRLVTLTGPGGSGKTRLAEEAALAAPAPDDGSPDGAGSPGAAWLVELAPLDDPADVPGAVLSALRLRETHLISREGQAPQDDPTHRLVEHLASRSLLLVLDNCEHVIDAAAALAETLLTRCPRLRVLATSREPLGVPGETVRPVEPLPPDPAHRLFAERARAVRPDFALAAEGAPGDEDAVDEICRRLDGLPLAIELAAARLRLLTPRQIADRLDDRFRLLTSGSRTVLPRQQTLRAVVDWSWDLLDAGERTLLRRLSVFAGGWDLAAAEALVPNAADPLGALVDKSLVVATPTDDGEMRYRLLETIHEYAVERAAERPDVRAAAEAAHTAHYTALAERAEPLLRSREQLPWIRRIETDLDNIRAALHRTTVTAPDEAAAHRLVLAIGWFWGLRNYRTEGLAWTERALRLGEDPDDPEDPRYWPRMRLRMLSFFLAVENRSPADLREDPELGALVRRVRDAFRERPGPRSAHFPGFLWPFTAYLTEDHTVIRAMLDAAVENCRRHGGEWEIGVILMFRTHLVIDMPGELQGVDDDLAELLVLSRRVGDRWMRAQVASAAGEAHMMRGRHAEAAEAYEEALVLAREVGAHAESPFLIARLAELAYRSGDVQAAEKGLDEAEAEADRHHVDDVETFVRYMRAVLALYQGEVRTARAHLDAASRLILTGSPPPHFNAAVTGLAARVSADEGGGVEAVAQVVEALRVARQAQCAEFITAQLGETVAAVLARQNGALPLAVRVLAAVDTWRAGIPRSVPELRDAESLMTQARNELGETATAKAYAEGAPLTLDEVIALVDAYEAELRRG
ncbi:BTAD domain-containing putative transcriptional regulator [Streptomyces sp. P9(2023)]|uniref:BTAD domain-containing putative transcriptional regulator n=1 Tax=Streptomyces sp. P9(2023) TaxID=3064394 RepID=UPI0028F451F5|nr:BTAD domain-containing putative transcriptional regulator [Streptomyces sp. P9(2023)]MDT9693451.1 BTAD domain-containing putative transcriptional regulator [Streptomyces sp. P9(2023)]